MQRHFKDYLSIFCKGLAMGAADVVPGVSGGTIAFISGIYQELITTIDTLDFQFFSLWKKEGFKTAWKTYNLSFLAALGIGIAFSILSLAKGIKWLLHHEPTVLWAFFFGLVLASIVYIGKQIAVWNLKVFLGISGAAILSYMLTIAEPIASPESIWYLIFCGCIAIIAMILPGVSGAFILLILGAYQTFIEILNQLREGVTTANLSLFWEAFYKLICIGIGAVVGLKLFSKVLTWMFTHHKNMTLAILTGFMVGSLNKLWPWKKVLSWRTNTKGLQIPFIEKSIWPTQFEGDPKLIWVLIFALLGFGLILLLERLASQKQT